MKWYLTTFVSIGLIASPTFAKQQSNKQLFDKAFFAKYTVQTAWDMTQIIPGFHPDYGATVRGFTGGGGNILIDGKRPSVKSGNISDILHNLAAKDVDNIELIVGSTGVGDAAQKSTIINIIRTKATTSLRVETTANYVDQGEIKPKLLLNYASQWQDWSYQVNSLYEEKKIPKNSRVWQYDKQDLTAHYQQSQVAAFREYTLTTDASRFIEQNKLDIFTKIKWSNYHPVTSRVTRDREQPFFHNDRDSEYYMAEFGLDYGFNLNNQWQGRSQAIFLANHWTVDRNTTHSPITPSPDASAIELLRYDFERDKTESIIKGTWFNTELDWQPEFGGEIAFNQSDFDSTFTSSIDGITQAIPQNAANVVISELRSDIFLRGNNALTPQLRLNYALAAEYSQLKVTGEASNQQNYLFFKPSLSLIYTAESGWTWQNQIQRTVGQLDFKLFAAQSNLVDDRNTAGNPQLKPDSATKLSTTFNYTFINHAAFSFSLYHDWRQDVLEQIVLPSGHIGTGNAGDARVIGATTQFTLPLEHILPQGQLSLNATTFDGDFTDPQTGNSRQLTGTKKPEIKVSIRQDNLWDSVSWGASYTAENTTNNYYVAEHSKVIQDEIWTFFIEKQLASGWRIKLDVTDLGTPLQLNKRSFFTDSHAKTINAHHHNETEQPWQANLSASIVL
ncbi:TonB-dependent siderophore receptor [Psychrobium sp. 1_MG-2023]|uniref:TonB-dependent receptor plug domain-containing protein n=1 Tax=Psychrobium sp. 1_MG-2023 TaxID=3062624 RepID=UPI000C323DE0|nr:TonB-dependent receptor [Psychrobium sp. 1_MG-2023]MDP2561610.1 TonB-dependent receptor [Psychrobium sp. 1_MG-2023]PKF55629.1 hypothetical protein CW748_12275 [Alteromonadales bacterium alter-6D02]